MKLLPFLVECPAPFPRSRISTWHHLNAMNAVSLFLSVHNMTQWNGLKLSQKFCKSLLVLDEIYIHFYPWCTIPLMKNRYNRRPNEENKMELPAILFSVLGAVLAGLMYSLLWAHNRAKSGRRQHHLVMSQNVHTWTACILNKKEINRE